MDTPIIIMTVMMTDRMTMAMEIITTATITVTIMVMKTTTTITTTAAGTIPAAISRTVVMITDTAITTMAVTGMNLQNLPANSAAGKTKVGEGSHRKRNGTPSAVFGASFGNC